MRHDAERREWPSYNRRTAVTPPHTHTHTHTHAHTHTRASILNGSDDHALQLPLDGGEQHCSKYTDRTSSYIFQQATHTCLLCSARHPFARKRKPHRDNSSSRRKKPLQRLCSSSTYKQEPYNITSPGSPPLRMDRRALPLAKGMHATACKNANTPMRQVNT